MLILIVMDLGPAVALPLVHLNRQEVAIVIKCNGLYKATCQEMFGSTKTCPTAFVSSLLRHSGVPRSVACNPWGWSRPACEVQEEFQGDRPSEFGMLCFKLATMFWFVSPNW